MKPELKYPAEKCFDLIRFQLRLESEFNIDITEIPTEDYGTKSIKRNTGNFYRIFDYINPIFPKISPQDIYNEKQKKEYEQLGIPFTPYRFCEKKSIYELPIKYDSSNDEKNWLERKDEFFSHMKKMCKLSGGKWTQNNVDTYNEHVDFGPKSFEWYNIVLDKLYELYPQYYTDGKIKIWSDENGLKSEYDYPYEKSYILSELEEWLVDTFNADVDGLYEWLLDCQFIEGRHWDVTFRYDIEDETFRGKEAPKNILQINEIFRQLFKTETMPIFIDYYKEYKE